MKYRLFFLLLGTMAFAQKEHDKITFTVFDLAASFRGNPNHGEIDPYTGEKGYWLIPDGLSGKFGYGIHYNQWLLASANTGVDWKVTYPLVTVPVFGNLRMSPKVGPETRIYFQMGYGKAFAIGKGDLSGDYRRYSIGLEADSVSIFIDVSQYGFRLGEGKISSFSIGLSLVTF